MSQLCRSENWVDLEDDEHDASYAYSSAHVYMARIPRIMRAETREALAEVWTWGPAFENVLLDSEQRCEAACLRVMRVCM